MKPRTTTTISNDGDDDSEDACGTNTMDGRTKENRLNEKVINYFVFKLWSMGGGGGVLEEVGKEKKLLYFFTMLQTLDAQAHKSSTGRYKTIDWALDRAADKAANTECAPPVCRSWCALNCEFDTMRQRSSFALSLP